MSAKLKVSDLSQTLQIYCIIPTLNFDEVYYARAMTIESSLMGGCGMNMQKTAAVVLV